MNPNISSKVIGYFAFKSPNQVICHGDACVIAGSEQRMKEYIGLGVSESSGIQTIKKTRFGEIMKGIEIGASYAFDEQSYNRFYPLANRIGFKLKEEDFSDKAETGFHFVVIALQELK